MTDLDMTAKRHNQNTPRSEINDRLYDNIYDI